MTFNEWISSKQTRPRESYEFHREIWQAATAATARRCDMFVRSLPATRDGISEAIRAEFPDAFEGEGK